jgi:hypothetical protein
MNVIGTSMFCKRPQQSLSNAESLHQFPIDTHACERYPRGVLHDTGLRRVLQDAVGHAHIPDRSIGQPAQGYLRDGRIEIDNNLIENSIGPTAVGRNAALVVGLSQEWR